MKHLSDGLQFLWIVSLFKSASHAVWSGMSELGVFAWQRQSGCAWTLMAFMCSFSEHVKGNPAERCSHTCWNGACSEASGRWINDQTGEARDFLERWILYTLNILNTPFYSMYKNNVSFIKPLTSLQGFLPISSKRDHLQEKNDVGVTNAAV